jgi:hypothetical protein
MPARRWWRRADGEDIDGLSGDNSIGVAAGGRVFGSETGRHGSHISTTDAAAQPLAVSFLFEVQMQKL